MFSLAMDICKSSSILKTLNLVRTIIYILKILIPIVIMFKIIKDIFNDMTGSNPEKVTGNASKIVKLLFVALLIFAIPTIFKNIMRMFVNYEEVENNFIDCQACLDNRVDCDTAIQIAEYQEEKEKIDINVTESITSHLTEADIKKDKDGNKDDGSGSDAETVGGGKYFDRKDVTKISGLTAAELAQKLKNCKKYGGKAKRYVPYAEDLIAAEKKWGINVFYMLGVYSLESGWTGSSLARKCNNWGGIKYSSKQTYNGKHTSRCWQQKDGDWFAGFNKPAGFFEYHCKLVKTKYVTPGAPYYHGKTPEAISQVYGHKKSVGTVISIATTLANS